MVKGLKHLPYEERAKEIETFQSEKEVAGGGGGRESIIEAYMSLQVLCWKFSLQVHCTIFSVQRGPLLALFETHLCPPFGTHNRTNSTPSPPTPSCFGSGMQHGQEAKTSILHQDQFTPCGVLSGDSVPSGGLASIHLIDSPQGGPKCNSRTGQAPGTAGTD